MAAALGAPYFSLVSDWAAPGVLRLQGWDRGIIHGQIFLNIPLGLWKTWGSAHKAGEKGIYKLQGKALVVSNLLKHPNARHLQPGGIWEQGMGLECGAGPEMSSKACG